MFEQELMAGVRLAGIVPMFIMAFLLVLKNRSKVVRSAVYNRSRIFLVAATLLLGIHFLIQFFGHYRETNPSLCWTLNILFYIAIAPLFNMAELNLLRAGRNMKPRYWSNGIFVLLCYSLFAIGYFTDTLINNDTPFMTMTFVVGIIYFLKLIELSSVLGREFRKTRSYLTDGELKERHKVLRLTAWVMKCLIFCSLLLPWICMSPSLLLNSLYGIVYFPLVVLFLVRFLQYGANMEEVVAMNDEILESKIAEAEARTGINHPSELPTTKVDAVKQRVDRWVAERHYVNASITIQDALKQMGLTLSALNYYIRTYTDQKGYRQWLPVLRIEESKRIMREHPEYSLQAIAESCGYSNNANFTRAFKEKEGVPPSEWGHINVGAGKLSKKSTTNECCKCDTNDYPPPYFADIEVFTHIALLQKYKFMISHLS